MPEYPIDLPVDRIWRFVKSEAEGDFANSHINGRKEHRWLDGEGAGRLVEEATLDIEPFVERNYWVLRLVGQRDIEPPPAGEDPPAPDPAYPPDRFEEEFIAAPGARTTARLIVETEAARRRFDTWIRPVGDASNRDS